MAHRAFSTHFFLSKLNSAEKLQSSTAPGLLVLTVCTLGWAHSRRSPGKRVSILANPSNSALEGHRRSCMARPQDAAKAQPTPLLEAKGFGHNLAPLSSLPERGLCRGSVLGSRCTCYPQRELTHSAAILADEERCVGRGNNCYLTNWYSWKMQETFHGNKAFFRPGTEAENGKPSPGREQLL